VHLKAAGRTTLRRGSPTEQFAVTIGKAKNLIAWFEVVQRRWNMPVRWVFDNEETLRFTEARLNHLKILLSDDLIGGYSIGTALDVGCGLGDFSSYLAGRGLKVTAVDGRAENIAEARRRYENIEFHVVDVENSRARELGHFDLVLCYGLLYHLENPFKALRSLSELTAKIMLMETMIIPGTWPMAGIVDEAPGEDQGLNYHAFIPAEPALIRMLYYSGFKNVYALLELPNHEHFREGMVHKRKRTILVASKSDIRHPMMLRVHEPKPRYINDYSRKKWASVAKRVAELIHLRRTV